MTYAEALIRLRQTNLPEKIVKYELHDPERCLAGAWGTEMKTPQPTCRCGGAKQNGYGYSVVLK